jgi:hypothetical protein
VFTAPFPLAGGDFLLAGKSGGWLRMSAAGRPRGKMFPDRLTAEKITPQFERGGKLWVIRTFAGGTRKLERRNLADGSLDNGFSQAPEWPEMPSGAVAGPGETVWVLTGELSDGYFWPFDVVIPQRHLIQADGSGKMIGKGRKLPDHRSATLVAGPAGSFRVELGSDQSRNWYWPVPQFETRLIEFCSADGQVERTQDFGFPIHSTFQWAEGADGAFVALDGFELYEGGPQKWISRNPRLRRFNLDGSEDLTFRSPGGVRSVKSLPGGKWLIDGLRRINADGTEDLSWREPELERPAEVRKLFPLGGGRMLVSGNFAMVNGQVKNRLVILRTDGSVDPSFTADDQIGEIQSVSLAGNKIYVVTGAPVAVTADFSSKLLRLRLDGSIDGPVKIQSGGDLGGSYTLWTPPGIVVGIPVINLPISPATAIYENAPSASRVYGFPNGDALVVSYSGGEAASESVGRVFADGTVATRFSMAGEYRYYGDFFPLVSGGFVHDGAIHRVDGSIERDLKLGGNAPQPLCEWQGGIVFSESLSVGGPSRLRLWRGNGWDERFNPGVLPKDWSARLAVSGDWNSLFVCFAHLDGRSEIRRLSPRGQWDRSFRGPAFVYRERQRMGPWWEAEERGKLFYRPTANGTPVIPSTMIFTDGKLCLGGSFNHAGGRPRDGIVRIIGSCRSGR